MVILGGMDSEDQTLLSVVQFDPSTNRWASLPDMPQGRSAASIAAFDGKLVVAGGVDMDFNRLSSVQQLDLQTGCWSNLPDMPTARCSAGVTVLGDKLVIVGGKEGGCCGSDTSKSVLQFDAVNQAWSQLPDMPFGRCNASAAVIDSKLVVLGGQDDRYKVLKTVSQFDPATQCWTQLPDMPEQRCLGNMVMLMPRTQQVQVQGAGAGSGIWCKDSSQLIPIL